MAAERIRGEYVLAVKGLVRERPEGTINPNMPTGHVEVLVHELEILNRSETPPFHHDEHGVFFTASCPEKAPCVVIIAVKLTNR